MWVCGPVWIIGSYGVVSVEQVVRWSNVISTVQLYILHMMVAIMVSYYGLFCGFRGGICPCGLSLSLPQFQPWEKRAWWWSWFKEPPTPPFFITPFRTDAHHSIHIHSDGALPLVHICAKVGKHPWSPNFPFVLRSKGLKDATCVGWFGDDWDCSVGSPPEAIDHVSSTVPIGYAV